MNFTLRPATVADAGPACAVLRRAIIASCVADHRHDPQTLWCWLFNQTPENLATWFAAPHDYALLAIADHAVVGVAMLSGQGEVELCYALPEWQRGGVGSAMLQALETQARAWGLVQLQLESTITGLPFYLRHGFVRHGAPLAAWGLTAYPLRKALA